MEIIQPFLEAIKNIPGFSAIYYLIVSSIAFVLFYRYVIIPLWNGCWAIHGFFVAADKTMSQVSEIKKELSTNGGSSMKDMLNHCIQKITDLTSYVMKIEDKQRILLNSFGIHGVGFFETNSKGECVSVTPTYIQLTGLSEEELLGFNWLLAIHPEDKAAVLNEWQSCTELKRVFSMRYRYLNRRNGDVTKIECTATPIRVEGEISGFLGTVEKIE